jgi:hypothetical protein
VRAGLERREFARARTDDDEHERYAIAFRFVHAERGRNGAPAGWNDHHKLAGTNVTRKIGRFDADDDDIGDRLAAIADDGLVYRGQPFRCGHSLVLPEIHSESPRERNEP